MSTEGEINSNVTPDVVEQAYSLSNSGRSRSGGRSSSRQNRTEIANTSNSSRGRSSRSQGRSGRMRFGSKDGIAERQVNFLSLFPDLYSQ